MTAATTIEWTDATWNPVRGCTRVSAGCVNCYAETMAARFSDPGYWGHGLAVRHRRPDGGMEGRWTGAVQPAPDHVLTWPLRYKGHPQARAEGRRTRIFVNSTSDLFHEALPDAAIDRVFAVMALAHEHDYQVLTKRSGRMRTYMSDPETPGRVALAMMELAPIGKALAVKPVLSPGRPMSLTAWPLPNVWLGVSTEDQPTADERIPDLLSTPAAVRFISAEPLLGPLDLTDHCTGWYFQNFLTGARWHDAPDDVHSVSDMAGGKLDWVITGGESGPRARPMHPDWPRQLRDQCAAAGVAFFFKQWGQHAPVYDRDRDDPDWRRCDEIQRKNPTGRWLNLAGGHGFHGERVHYVAPVGKHAAGALLDGREHKAFPSPAIIPANAGSQAY